MITASLKNYRISPRKVRGVADMIRGKSVAQAQIILTNASEKATGPLSDLLTSAVANASHNHKIGPDSLIVKEIRVDQGYVLERMMPMSRGSAFPIKKRTSHVSIILAPKDEMIKQKGTKGNVKVVSKNTITQKSTKKTTVALNSLVS